MPVISLPLQDGRCLLNVLVSVPEASATVPARALIDTGADITCIDPRIVALLGATASGSISPAVPYGTPAGEPTDTYQVDLTILHPTGKPEDNLHRPALKVAGVPIAHTGSDVLIGNDLLDECDFHRDGPRQMFHISY